MIRLRVLITFVGFFAIALNGCASSRARPETTDRIPAKQSSYRIRGTQATGMLSDSQKARLRAKTRAWRWPTDYVTVTSNFGARKNEHHDGIDLRASVGTPVHAAYDGKVIYAGARISGYGRMVVLRHGGKLSTIYAHNSKLYVKTGQKVRRGQLLALSGNTGRSSGPHVHFEVREGVTAINPLILLPAPAVANEASRRIAAIEAKRSASGRVRSTASSARRRTTVKSRYSQSSSKRVGARVAARVAQGDDGFRPRSRLKRQPGESSP